MSCLSATTLRRIIQASESAAVTFTETYGTAISRDALSELEGPSTRLPDILINREKSFFARAVAALLRSQAQRKPSKPGTPASMADVPARPYWPSSFAISAAAVAASSEFSL
jgi:hypothetical protein